MEVVASSTKCFARSSEVIATCIEVSKLLLQFYQQLVISVLGLEGDSPLIRLSPHGIAIL